MEAILRNLVQAAILAPSGDNLQPWKFTIDPLAARIGIILDENRDPSPMNAGQRMSRIAIGAALENIFQAAQGLGCTVTPVDPHQDECAAVQVADCHGSAGPINPAIAARVTNRRLYDGRTLDPEVARDLQSQTSELNGVRARWITDRNRIGSLARLIGRADAIMFGELSMRRAFLENVRFDAPWNAEVEEGLPLAALELSAADRFAFRMLPRIPNWLLKVAQARRKFAATARRLVESASGLCLVVQRECTPKSDVLAGRAVQRAWLALTARGLAAQPMMSLVVLDNVLGYGAPELLARLGRDGPPSLVAEFRDIVPEIGSDRLAFLVRFGYAPPPTARTGRLPLSANVRVNTVAAGANVL